MSNSYTYGVVVGKTFFSDRIKRRVEVENGIYSLDKTADNLWSTLALADITEATKFFRRNNRFLVVRGVSFHNGFVPDNPVRFPKIPISVIDGQFEEFEYIETIIGEFGCYYLQSLATQETYSLIEIKECFEKNTSTTGLKNLTPPMRVVYSFHCIEQLKIQQKKLAKEQAEREKEPINVIRKRLEESGATVISIKAKRNGFEVVWELEDETINSLVSMDYRIIEAGFCTSGGDRSQSITSVPNLLKTYKEDGSWIHKTRSVN